MKELKIPFEIGMQYENWEFVLEIIIDRIHGCDSYSYKGKEFNNFLNNSEFKTELIFNLDVLEGVLITMDNLQINFYKLSKTVARKLNTVPIVNVKNHLKYCKFVTHTVEVWIIKNSSFVYFLISNPSYCERIINTL